LARRRLAQALVREDTAELYQNGKSCFQSIGYIKAESRFLTGFFNRLPPEPPGKDPWLVLREPTAPGHSILGVREANGERQLLRRTGNLVPEGVQAFMRVLLGMNLGRKRPAGKMAKSSGLMGNHRSIVGGFLQQPETSVFRIKDGR